MTSIAKGANLPIPTAAVRAELHWRPEAGAPDPDFCALLLTDTGQVRSDDDIIFYNQPDHPASAVNYAGKGSGTDTITLNLDGIEPAITRIVLSASTDDGTFGQIPDLYLTVAPEGAEAIRFDMTATTETAFLTGELYRRGDQWKFRALGQGYATGLAGLATDFGITVAEDPAPPVPSTPEAAPVPAPEPAAARETEVAPASAVVPEPEVAPASEVAREPWRPAAMFPTTYVPSSR